MSWHTLRLTFEPSTTSEKLDAVLDLLERVDIDIETPRLRAGETPPEIVLPWRHPCPPWDDPELLACVLSTTGVCGTLGLWAGGEEDEPQGRPEVTAVPVGQSPHDLTTLTGLCAILTRLDAERQRMARPEPAIDTALAHLLPAVLRWMNTLRELLVAASTPLPPMPRAGGDAPGGGR